jgi:membrane-associated phospholipid phosphatase
MAHRPRALGGPAGRRRLKLVFLSIALTLGIAITAYTASSPWGTRLDTRVQKAFAAPETSARFQLAFHIDDDVELVVVGVAVISFVLALLLWGPRYALSIVISVGLAGGLAGLLKEFAPLVPPSGSSWPSAHASAVAALGASILILPRRRSARWAIGLVSATYLVIVCLSLLVVRAHQLADLLGGCLIGAWAIATVAAILDPLADHGAPLGNDP